MFRLMAMIGVVTLVYFVVRWLRQPARKRLQSETRIMPFCPKCESNRNVVANSGGHPHYPTESYGWFCQHCEEGF